MQPHPRGLAAPVRVVVKQDAASADIETASGFAFAKAVATQDGRPHRAVTQNNARILRAAPSSELSTPRWAIISLL